MDPLIRIRQFLAQMTELKLLGPMCLSTVSRDGYPSSRFVDLKGVTDTSLLFGTDERSPKAKEFTRDSRVSCCMWWDSLGVQIRVLGQVSKTSREISDKIFESRNNTAKAIATLSIQSSPLASLESLTQEVEALVVRSQGMIERPPTWWVYEVTPMQIEILQFSKDRIHLRTQYVLEEKTWRTYNLSP